MNLSAKNQFKGTITNITEGVVTGIVTVDIGGGNIVTSSITMDSIKSLDLKVGKEVVALVKASNVMIGLND
ncbi:TOBE domain-containing protein [Gudongella sp. SC589]|jgi:molybdopterin-binding protein|uniref:TOBE domain-containing protein n=1 Tax=Gudongella sp. SC589 TaxID=3385990 RepID=UPI003904A664